jgi:hypothetical protein
MMVIGGGVGFVALLVLGFGLAALLLFPVMVLGERLALPPRTKRIVESAAMPFSCQSVWNLIQPAENAPVMSTQVMRGYRVPGTPDGVGERQAGEQADGTTFIVEVVECAPGRRAVTVPVSPQPVLPYRVVFDLTPTDVGCVFQLSQEIQLPRGKRLVHGSESVIRASLRESLTRTHAALNANSWGPPSAPPPALN